ncbi:MAG: hypothetical protein H0Z37_04930 [Firmicutes bacterium]|nr:hypothetical protein [Bacillota bacterium]
MSARVWMLVVLLMAGLVGGVAPAVRAQEVGVQANVDVPVESDAALEPGVQYHYVTGFRSARWGMTRDEVREAIKKDFNVDDSEIGETFNLDQGTLIMGVTVPSLSPGPGPASIYYIFGATSERLMYINVVWSTSDEPIEDERSRIIVAGLQLANYFQRLSWRPEAAVTSISLDPGNVVAFAGVDPDGAGVQVIMLNVPMTDEEGNPVELSGPSVLQVSYSARFGEPDVVTIEPGAF